MSTRHLRHRKTSPWDHLVLSRTSDECRLYLNSFCRRLPDCQTAIDATRTSYLRVLSRRGGPSSQLQMLLRWPREPHGYQSVAKKRWLNLVIPLPRTSPEQRAVATILSDMDSEIAALEHRLDKTRAIKQGMMQQLLGGSIRLPIPDDDTEDDDAHDA